MPSSGASAICRVEWRPSRLLSVVLALLGGLGALSVLVSEAPRSAAWPVACASILAGVAMALREARRAPRDLVVAATIGASRVDGRPAEALRVSWRGPLAFLAWRDEAGRLQRMSFWPDTLPARQRRELRLAAPAPDAAARSPSVAP